MLQTSRLSGVLGSPRGSPGEACSRIFFSTQLFNIMEVRVKTRMMCR
jgi:hypothetical protein